MTRQHRSFLAASCLALAGAFALPAFAQGSTDNPSCGPKDDGKSDGKKSRSEAEPRCGGTQGPKSDTKGGTKNPSNADAECGAPKDDKKDTPPKNPSLGS